MTSGEKKAGPSSGSLVAAGRSPGGRLPVPGLILLAALCLFLFFHRLADRDLWSSHEARAGMDAQSLLDGGGWGLPRLFDSRVELQKPPLYYWLVAAVARLRGGDVDAWAVRLPAAGSALACVFVLVAFGAGRGRLAAGLIAGTVLATGIGFTWLARIGRIDMPLALCVTGALAAHYCAWHETILVGRRYAFLICGYLAVAAAVLLKGPIGLVLPSAVAACHLLLEGAFPAVWRLQAWGRLLHRLGLWWGLPLAGGLTLPWFVWADGSTGGELSRVFLGHHNLDRALGGTELATHPWWLYGPYFALYFLPWTMLLPAAGWWCIRKGYWRDDADARYGVAWLAGVVGVLSLAAFKRADYLLPAYPGAAWFIGCVIERRSAEALAAAGEKKVRVARRWTVAFGGVVGLLSVGWVVQVGWRLPAEERKRDYRAFAAAVRAAAPPPEEVVFFRTEAHALAFHVGRPLAVLVEWQELRARLVQPGPHIVVMPPAAREEAAREMPGVTLDPVTSNTELAGGVHERPLVLLRVRPLTPPSHARVSAAASGLR